MTHQTNNGPAANDYPHTYRTSASLPRAFFKPQDAEAESQAARIVTVWLVAPVVMLAGVLLIAVLTAPPQKDIVAQTVQTAP